MVSRARVRASRRFEKRAEVARKQAAVIFFALLRLCFVRIGLTVLFNRCLSVKSVVKTISEATDYADQTRMINGAEGMKGVSVGAGFGLSLGRVRRIADGGHSCSQPASG